MIFHRPELSQHPSNSREMLDIPAASVLSPFSVLFLCSVAGSCNPFHELSVQSAAIAYESVDRQGEALFTADHCLSFQTTNYREHNVVRKILALQLACAGSNDYSCGSPVLPVTLRDHDRAYTCLLTASLLPAAPGLVIKTFRPEVSHIHIAALYMEGLLSFIYMRHS